MTLLQLIINIIIFIISRKLFYVLWNQWDFLRNEHIQAGTATFLLTVTEKKKQPNCDLNAEVCTEPWLLWNVPPPKIQLVPFATNERKKQQQQQPKYWVGLFFNRNKTNSKSTHAYSWSQVIYFFMDSSIHLLEQIPPKHDLDEWKLYC